jgi:PAS domain S-box-containing protein
MGVDITEQKHQQDRMRMLSSAITSASDAIIITDNDLNPTPTVLYANPAFTRLTGYTNEELIGRRTSETFGARMDSQSAIEIQRVLSSGNSFHGEVTNYTKDGRRLQLELDIVPVRDSAGKATHFVAVRRDISHRKAEELSRQRLLQLVLEAQTEERRRVSRELHDDAGQLLTSMLLRLNVLQEATSDQAVKQAVREISSVASSTLEDISRLARGLHPAVLEDLGLTVALRRAVEEFGSSGVAATFAATGSAEQLPKHIEHEIYQIVKEALTNVQRHARADRVRVALEKGAASVTATITDNGVGFDPRESAAVNEGHLGIVGMSERATLLGGTLLVSSVPGEGTTVKLTVPLSTTEKTVGR